LSIVVVLLTSFYILFVRKTQSKEEKKVLEKKLRTVYALMDTQIKQAKKREEAKRKEEAEKNGDKKEDQKKKDADDDEDDKQVKEPEASKLFDILFDESEEGLVTKLGIPQDEPRFLKVRNLLQRAMEKELQDGVMKTKKARGMLKMEDDDDKKALAEYEDGSKLQNSVKLCKEKVLKYLGNDFITSASLTEAIDLTKEVAREQRRTVGTLLAVAWQFVPLYVVGCLCSSVDAIFYSILLSMQNQVAEQAAEKDGLQKAKEGCITILIGFALSQMFDRFGRLCMSKVSSNFQLKLKSTVMHALVRQDVEYFDKHNAGALQERLNRDASELSQNFFGLPGMVFRSIASLTGQAAYLYQLAPDMFLRTMMPIPLAACCQYFLFKYLRTLMARTRALSERAASSTIEIIKEIRTVREFGMDFTEAEQYASNATYANRITESTGVTRSGVFFLLTMLTQASKMVNLYQGAGQVHDGILKVTDLIVIVTMASQLTWKIESLFNTIPKLANTMEPAGRICELLSSKPKIELAEDVDTSKFRSPDKINGNIDFENVYFSYPTATSKVVLKNVSFKVCSGQKVALVGEAGCGKSSTVRLVERFYAPTQGRILIDGHPIEEYNVIQLRKKMAVVAQDNVLFAASIKENIIYGMKPEPSQEQIIDACKKASSWDFISEFEDQLETLVGERGIKLSGGQKQRVTIARAIIRAPQILLLDEATAALDAVNERLVQKALDEMMKTSHGSAIVIAHRLTTIRNCDNIIVFDHGEVKEQGTHDELMSIAVTKEDNKIVTGWYHNLWDTQMGMGDNVLSIQQLEKKIAALEDEITGHKDHRKQMRTHVAKFRSAGHMFALAAKHSSAADEDDHEHQITTKLHW